MRTDPRLLVVVLAVATSPAVRADGPPRAARRPVTDSYHGVTVVDDYRWLEDGKDPAVAKWVGALSERSRRQLEALPATQALTRRLLAVDEARPVELWPFRVGATWYATEKVPGKTWPILVRLAAPDDAAGAQPLFDPNAVDPKGLTAPDFWEPSYDGKKLAVSLSQRGSEDGTLSVVDLVTGKLLPDEIPRVHGGTAGGGVAWTRDSSGFYYTRYPRKGERPDADLSFYQEIWYHALGTPTDKDRSVLARELPKIAESSFVASADGGRLLVQTLNGDGGEVAFFARTAGGAFAPLTRFADQVTAAQFGVDGSIYLLTTKDAPKGRIVRLPPDVTDLARAEPVVPEGEGQIESFVATRSRLYVAELVGGPSELRAYDLAGKGGEVVPVPPVSSIGALERIDPASDEILFATESYLEPHAEYRYAPGGAPVKTALSTRSPLDFSPYEVERLEARSKDGTRVPMTVIHRKGMARDGQNPTLLNGYGGYRISMTPSFKPGLIVWLEQGGVYAIANLRGGLEFGESWHEQGKLTRKQNVFDDFIACAERLVEAKITSPARLAIEGGSNGGLLMGAALTQRPDLFRAVVSSVGIYDMLRVERSDNGAFNVTEYGTVEDPDQFAALYAYSPYHHVRDGVRYPALLLITGDNDPRVDPMQSRKFAARLLAAGAKDVLLYTNPDAGHGVPERSQRLRQKAYEYAFIMDRLGMKRRR